MAKIAIIETGGKQYLVEDGAVLKVEKIIGSKVGSTITFDKVLLTDDGSNTQVGAPFIDGAKVSAEIIDEGRYPTVRVIKYRPKSRYFKKRGHRQEYATIKISL